MTTFTIISLGNVEFLGQVLNAVAMVCGTGNFQQLCICGAIIGLLFIGFQCIFQGGQRINLQHTLVCMICYMLFFGPSCTVVVEDAQSSTYTRTIDNVPFGVGVAGTTISGIGYGLTKLIEQAYGTPDRTADYSYNEPLKILTSLRNATESDEIWSTLDGICGAGCNTRQATINYLSECTATAMQQGRITNTEIYKADLGSADAGGVDIFKFDSPAYMTMLPIVEGGKLVGASEDGYVTCKEGWPILKKAVFNKLKTTEVATQLNKMLGNKEISADGTKKVVADWSRIQGSFESLGITATTAQDFVVASVIRPTFEKAAASYYTKMQDYSKALAINQAIAQRNVQWAAEQSMFLSSARAFIAYFEGFVYAITPIVGFLMMVGAFGLSLVGKYFLVLVWIQLWLPCMSIANLYTMTGARSDMISASLGGASFYAVDDMLAQAQTWVATGGFLFAATPMMALFLVGGSMYAFTTLANRLQGQDHFNEKMVAPDAVQVGAVQSVAPTQSYNRYAGALASGAEQIMPSAAAMTQMANAVSSAKTNMENETASLAAGFAKTGGTDTSFGTNNSAINTIAKSVGATQVSGTSTFQDVVERVGQQFNATADEKNAVTARFGAAAKAGIDAGKENGQEKDEKGRTIKDSPFALFSNIAKEKGLAGAVARAIGIEAGVNVSGETSNTDTATDGTSFSHSNTSGEGASRLKSLQSSLANAFTAGVSNVSSDSWAESSRVTKNASMSKQFASMSSTAKTYSESKSISDYLALSQGNRALNTIAQRLNNTEKGRQVLDDLQGYGINEHFSSERLGKIADDKKYFAQMIANGTTPTDADEQKAQAMAAMNDMLNHGDFARYAKIATATDLPSTRANEFNMQSPDYVNGAMPGQTASMRDKAESEISGYKAKVDAGKASVPKAEYGDGAEIVDGLKTEYDANVDNQAGKNFADVTQKHKQALLETLQETRGDSLAILLAKKGVAGAAFGLFDGKSPVEKPTDAAKKGLGAALWDDVTRNIKERSLNMTSFKDFFSLHEQDLKGMSQAQVNYVSASFRTVKMFDGRVGSEEQLKNFTNATNALREEIKDHVFGKNYDEKRDKETLDAYTKGMTIQLESLMSNKTQGYSTKVLDFNRTFKVETAKGQKIS